MATASRNSLVENAVGQAIARIDAFGDGATLDLPAPNYRQACDQMLASQSPSVKTGILFLLFYRLEDPAWDLNAVPIGARGSFGDKKLSEELTRRSITLHNAIVAWAENVGIKGGARTFELLKDVRFKDFLQSVRDADGPEQRRIADYIAQQFAASKRLQAPLPPVGGDVLTFARAKTLLHAILGLKSEGHIQQFLISALLAEWRRPQQIEVRTHHPHAADTFDATAGDIEEFIDGRLLRAYEVTMRPDWQHRLSSFSKKMDRFGLSKYILIADQINSDPVWRDPARMALGIEQSGRDIAVIDIYDVVHFLAMELSPKQLRDAINQVYAYLAHPKLSGRHDLMELYRDAVREWLDQL